jgi:hypothetical protein
MKYYQLLIRIFSCIFILHIISVSLSAEQAKTINQENIKFQWTFLATKNASQNAHIEPIARDTILKSGDQIKFFIRLQNSCHVYLIYHSSQDELSVLFPHRFKLKKGKKTVAINHYIPKGDQWFELDEHKGEERFYLIASVERLLELESLVNDYETADAAKKLSLGKMILSEIRKLRKKYLKFKAYAERPVSIVGRLRGTDKNEPAGALDAAKYAIEISADTFYSRTFTIDHQ